MVKERKHDIGALLEASVESKLTNFADFYKSAVSVYLQTRKFSLKISNFTFQENTNYKH